MPPLTLEQLDYHRRLANRTRATWIAAKTGTCEFCMKVPGECQCSINGFWPKYRAGEFEVWYNQALDEADASVREWIRQLEGK